MRRLARPCQVSGDTPRQRGSQSQFGSVPPVLWSRLCRSRRWRNRRVVAGHVGDFLVRDGVAAEYIAARRLARGPATSHWCQTMDCASPGTHIQIALRRSTTPSHLPMRSKQTVLEKASSDGNSPSSQGSSQFFVKLVPVGTNEVKIVFGKDLFDRCSDGGKEVRIAEADHQEHAVLRVSVTPDLCFGQFPHDAFDSTAALNNRRETPSH